MRKNVNRYVVEEVVYRKGMITTSTVCHCESRYRAEQVAFFLDIYSPRIVSDPPFSYLCRKIAKEFIPGTDDVHFSPADFSPADCTEMIKSLNE